MSKMIDYRARLLSIQEAIADSGLDGLMVTRTGAISYVAGCFVPWRTGIAIPREGEPELIILRYDARRLLDQCWIQRHRTWEITEEDSFALALVDSIKGWNLSRGRVGLELGGAQHPGVLSATEYQLITENSGDLEFSQGRHVLDRLMLHKTGAEVELLRRAAEIADVGMEAAFAAIAPGRTELEVAGHAEAAMRAAGNEFVWSVTGTELGSGYRQWYEEGFTVQPSNKRIQRGDIVTVDLHPMYECYLGDLALNAVVGEPSPEQQSLAAAWKAVCETILESLRPGEVIADIARAAKSTAEKSGYGDYLMPLLGHGLGTDARIPPIIIESNDERLEPNTIVEVHVHMSVPGVGGLKLETATLVTEDGCERLDKTPIELHIIDDSAETSRNTGSFLGAPTWEGEKDAR